VRSQIHYVYVYVNVYYYCIGLRLPTSAKNEGDQAYYIPDRSNVAGDMSPVSPAALTPMVASYAIIG